MARMPSREGILRALSLISKLVREISSASGSLKQRYCVIRSPQNLPVLCFIDPSKITGDHPANSPRQIYEKV